jgi:hypothetical protein
METDRDIIVTSNPWCLSPSTRVSKFCQLGATTFTVGPARTSSNRAIEGDRLTNESTPVAKKITKKDVLQESRERMNTLTGDHRSKIVQIRRRRRGIQSRRRQMKDNETDGDQCSGYLPRPIGSDLHQERQLAFIAPFRFPRAKIQKPGRVIHK